MCGWLDKFLVNCRIMVNIELFAALHSKTPEFGIVGPFVAELTKSTTRCAIIGNTMMCLHVQWYIQATCATQGNGLYEGLDWLSQELSKR